MASTRATSGTRHAGAGLTPQGRADRATAATSDPAGCPSLVGRAANGRRRLADCRFRRRTCANGTYAVLRVSIARPTLQSVLAADREGSCRLRASPKDGVGVIRWRPPEGRVEHGAQIAAGQVQAPDAD